MDRYEKAYAEIRSALLSVETMIHGEKPVNHPALRAEYLRLADQLAEPEASRARALADHFMAPPKKPSWFTRLAVSRFCSAK